MLKDQKNGIYKLLVVMGGLRRPPTSRRCQFRLLIRSSGANINFYVDAESRAHIAVAGWTGPSTDDCGGNVAQYKSYLNESVVAAVGPARGLLHGLSRCGRPWSWRTRRFVTESVRGVLYMDVGHGTRLEIAVHGRRTFLWGEDFQTEHITRKDELMS